MARTGHMKRMAGFWDKFVTIATAPHIVAQISLHPCLQPQTQAYPAPATCTLFTVNELQGDSDSAGLVTSRVFEIEGVLY